MKKFGTKQVMPLIIMAVCAVFIYTGMSKFGFWDPSKGPTAAFVPVIVCTLMLALCALDFVKSFKDTKPVKYYKPEFIMIVTGLILLVGLVFKQQWAFSGGLLIVYTFWIAIKAVRQNIRQSKNM